MSNNTTGRIIPVQSTEGQVRFAFYIISLILGTFGGMVVLSVIGTKKVRTLTDHHVFLANLALADMTTIWFYVGVNLTLLTGNLGQSFCHFWPLLSVPLCTSIFTITSMAVVRYRRIVLIWNHKMRLTTIILWVIGLWVASIIVLLPAVVVAKSAGRYCYLAWSQAYQRKIYTSALFVLQYLVPVLIIVIAYVAIGCNLKRYEGSVDRENIRNENRDIIKTLAIIATIFALFLMPFNIGFVMFEFGDIPMKKFALKFMNYSDILCIAHSCINPFVYGIVPREFRKHYSRWSSVFSRSLTKWSLNASYRLSTVQKNHEEGIVNECKQDESQRDSGVYLKTLSLQI